MVKKLLEAAGRLRETSGPGHAVACCAGTRISVTMSTWIWLLIGISLLIRKNEGGFGNPHEARALLQKLTGTPCECRGGTWNGETTPLLNVDCGDKTAYLVRRQNVHGAQAWVCSKKAKIIPTFNNKPGPCPCIEFHPPVHNTCYEQVQLCTGTDNNTYFTAILIRKIMDNPFWSGLNGFLPYLLPFLGPLLGLLILLSLGPFLFNKVMAFIKQQIDAIKMQPLQVHYHRLAMEDEHITITT
ncbi:uncharacterized protein LOC128567978 [Nycticebus coucang]|uniref:uncharacterized protein LOC128567978 n=1 Tax=Nycticebus coucang TaxID=9470 RepID=UPI00234D1921|nr:uncharacterized protein LOC128567978 [Nycticebus coucang]